MHLIRFQTLLLLSSTSISIFLTSSYAADTLSQGQSLPDVGKPSLISAGGVFEFGFFTPTAATTAPRYAGIWYHNISILTVVWVANRESPILLSQNSTPPTLHIKSDGNLALFSGGGGEIWSTNSTMTMKNSTVQISDLGNLILRAGNGTMVWQSCDEPGDTFLPGMKLSLDLNKGTNSKITSWKSPEDPATGNFSLGLDPSGSGQIFIWQGRTRWWRSGQWDGRNFIGATSRALDKYGFKLDTGGYSTGKMSLTFESFNASLLRFHLQWNGIENTSMLVGNSRTWEPVWVQPVTDCEIYGKCGGNGWCNIAGNPICECLRGFVPSSGEDWAAGNWSAGCVRRTTLGCESNDTNAKNSDGFYRLGGLKLPDRSTPRDSGAGGCESYCMTNCSCKAYAYGKSTIGCLTWSDDDLIDIYQFPPAVGVGYDLFIKLARSELGHSKHTWILIVTPILGALVIFILLALLWKKFGARVRGWWKCSSRETLSRILLFNSKDVIPDFSGPSEIDIGEEGQQGGASDLPSLSFDTLSAATNNFSESNKLGQGGFGIVYKGILPAGEEVAVKRLSANSGQGHQEFKNEVTLIAKLQHRNLVRTLGFCAEGDEKILVYEYMPNKSLDSYIFDKQGLLDWKTRFNIIEGIARGLQYLHHDSRLRIVHRDLKASNILLDANFNPKISDFGMARIFGGEQDQANTNRVVGTYGYMSPEYAMEGIFSDKSDMYSFGILILEIVTGKKNNSFHHLEDSPNIVGYAWPLWNEGRGMEMVDPAIRDSCSSRQVLRCIHIGLLCVQDRARDRPDMMKVVLMLGGETAILRMPKQPTFTTSEKDLRGTETVSANDVTITVLSGR